MGLKAKGGPVYSTDRGRLCPECHRPSGDCRCRSEQRAPVAPGDGIVRISRETKGRKGAGVTLIRGLPLAQEKLKALAGQLKQRCGSGGTVKDGVVEIQGDHRQVLLAELAKQGFKVKLAGG